MMGVGYDSRDDHRDDHRDDTKQTQKKRSIHNEYTHKMTDGGIF